MKKVQSPGHGEIYILEIEEVMKLPLGTMVYNLTGSEVEITDTTNIPGWVHYTPEEDIILSIYFVKEPLIGIFSSFTIEDL
jgi:hypothetical protein